MGLIRNGVLHLHRGFYDAPFGSFDEAHQCSHEFLGYKNRVGIGQCRNCKIFLILTGDGRKKLEHPGVEPVEPVFRAKMLQRSRRGDPPRPA